MSHPVARWPAPAKLNLFLHVTGRRPDGYHDLETLFQLIDLCDEIEVINTEKGSIVLENGAPGVAAEKDLVFRAARLLAELRASPIPAPPSHLAPALLASSAMNGALFDSTFNFFFKLRYAKVYDAILTTPVSVDDLALGELLWSNLRGVIYATAFLTVMFGFGLVSSPLALLAPVAVIFIGFAFGAAGFAITTHMRSWKDFDFIFIILTPLFLFSATFYPVEIYPEVLRWIVELSPLTRGTHLVRSLCFGDLNLFMLVDIAYLSAIGYAGYRHAVRRLGSLLLR